MPQASSKISPFPGPEPRPPFGAGAEAAAIEAPDPTRELRGFIEQLQLEVRDARERNGRVEEERNRLREEVLQLAGQVEASREAASKIRVLTRERAYVAEEQERMGENLEDFKRRLETAERQRVGMQHQRDEAVQLYKDAKRETEELQRAREEAIKQRDSALRQRDTNKRERDEFASKNPDLQRQVSELQQALLIAQQQDTKKADAALEKQMQALRLARDSATTQVSEFKARASELEDIVADLTYDRDEAERWAKRAEAEIAELRKTSESHATDDSQIAEMRAVIEELRVKNESLREGGEAQSAAAEKLAAELSEALIERDAARDQMVHQADAMDHFRTELEQTQANQNFQQLEEELARLRIQVDQAKTLAKHHAELRLQVIDVNCQLENSRAEIKELTASVAEARLLANRATKAARLNSAVVPVNDRPRPAPAAPLDEKNGHTLLTEMRAALQRVTAEAGDPKCVSELCGLAQTLADRAQTAGQVVMYRLGSGTAAYLRGLTEMAEPVSPAAGQVLEATIDLLFELLKERQLDRTVQLGEARAFVLDEDPSACERMTRALSSVGVGSDAAVHPAEGLVELATQNFDLILLDVNLPELNGAELCASIRELQHHAMTPVLFVATELGEGTAAQNLQASGYTVIGKPFDVAELGLRSLITIVRRRLQNS